MIHSLTGELTYQPYGKDRTECNYSVSRGILNNLLLTEAEQAGTNIHFNHALESANFVDGTLLFSSPTGSKRLSYNRIFGTDGAGSPTRKELIKLLSNRGVPHTCEVQPLGVAYKELLMPSGSQGNYPIDKDSLHIWPRGDHMLMALANLDGSFTMTLYLPETGEISFDQIATPDAIQKLFREKFSDAIPLMPHYIAEYQENPAGRLATLRCQPWHHRDNVLLLGDASHAIVPFFGQGMNSGFEDCTVLMSLLDAYNEDWGKIFEQFSLLQKANADSIADMAIENYIEMSEKVGDPRFLMRKSVEQILRKHFPNEYVSRYALVTYSLVPYNLVQKIGKIQTGILDTLCASLSQADQVDLRLAKEVIAEKLTPTLRENNINL